jgi:hypothetical protein
MVTQSHTGTATHSLQFQDRLQLGARRSAADQAGLMPCPPSSSQLCCCKDADPPPPSGLQVSLDGISFTSSQY